MPLSVETHYSTEEFVREFRSIQTLSCERKVSINRKATLIKSLEGGNLKDFDWAICECQENGEFYRINGNHTSELMSDGDLPDGCCIVLKNYSVPTLDDVKTLWTTFDNARSSRTKKEVFTIKTESKDGEARRIAIANALCTSKYGFREKNGVFSYNDLADVFNSEPEFVNWLEDLFNGAPSHSGDYFSIAAIWSMWATYNKDKSKAWDFWYECIHGLKTDEYGLVRVDNSPAKTLDHFLKRKSHGGLKRGATRTPFGVVNACMICFRNYVTVNHLSKINGWTKVKSYAGLSKYDMDVNSYGQVTRYGGLDF
jgi:hypothetical protein